MSLAYYIWHRGAVLQSVITERRSTSECKHDRSREIGQDFDEEGRLLRLVRCQKCGLLMREYLPSL